jgi:D-lactate dehydrogenase
MKTLVYGISGFDTPFLEKAALGKHELVFTSQFLDEETVFLAKGFEAISIFTSDNASAVILEKLYGCGVKFIASRSVGYEHIDISKAHALGIKVARVAYSPFGVAEHAVTLLLALNRKLLLGQKLMQIGDYRLDHLIGFDLHGKTIGIIGTGKIGSAFAKIMNGFGCKLLAYDPIKNEELIRQTSISYVTLEELCQKSDVLSLHCPFNSNTKYMINKTLFSKMKKGIVLINTARGGIVKTQDLINALYDGTIAAAGLDVYENEKAIFFNDLTNTQIKDDLYAILRSFPNVLVTGHQAFLTAEALQDIANATIANLNAWAFKGICENEIK